MFGNHQTNIFQNYCLLQLANICHSRINVCHSCITVYRSWLTSVLEPGGLKDARLFEPAPVARDLGAAAIR